MNQDRTQWAAAGGIVLFTGLAIVPLLGEPGGSFLIWRPALFSDLLVAHLPLSQLVSHALRSWGQVPLWNPLWLSGQPLLADPLAAMLYPPHWLTYLWPTTAAYNLLLWMHLCWAGWGQFRFGRALGLRPLAAFAAGVAFAGTPKLVGTLGLGHVTLLYAVSWTPWLLLAVRRAVTAKPVESTEPKHFARVGAAVAVTFLADPRWLLPAGGVALGYGIYLVIAQASGVSQRRRYARGAGLAAGLAGLLAGGLALPLAEFVPRTTRSSLDPTAAAELHLGATDLLSLLFPNPEQWPETTAALGISVVLLALCALLVNGKDKRFWLAAAGVALLLSLGEAGFVYPVLARLPGFALLRVPARLFLLVAFSASLLAGWGLQEIVGLKSSAAHLRRLRLGLVAGFGSMIAFVIGLSVLAGPRFAIGRAGVVWSLLLAGAVVCLLLAWAGSESRGRWLAWALPALLVIELGGFSLAALEARQVTAAVPDPIAQHLNESWGQARAFSPSYSVPAWWAAENGIELADGVDPLQLRSYWRFMADGLGYSQEEYSVTLPPFPSGDPSDPVYPDLATAELAMLNVRWLVAAYPLQAGELQPAGRWQGTWLYELPSARPRAWVQPSNELDPAGEWQPAEGLDWTPNRLQLRAEGPGWLVVAQNAYPGWRAMVSGEKREVEDAGGVLLAVELSEGMQNVTLRYQPLSVLIGLVLSLLGLVSLVWLELRR